MSRRVRACPGPPSRSCSTAARTRASPRRPDAGSSTPPATSATTPMAPPGRSRAAPPTRSASSSASRRSRCRSTRCSPRPCGASASEAHQGGYRVLVEPLSPERGRYSDLVRSHRVDGLIVSGPRIDDEELIALVADGYPIILQGSLPSLDAPSVDVDNRAGARTAVAHLIGLGHRRIGCITNAPLAYTAAADRAAGYRDALAEAGIDDDPALIVEGAFDAASGHAAALDAARARPGRQRAVRRQRHRRLRGDARRPRGGPPGAGGHVGRRLRRHPARAPLRPAPDDHPHPGPGTGSGGGPGARGAPRRAAMERADAPPHRADRARVDGRVRRRDTKSQRTDGKVASTATRRRSGSDRSHTFRNADDDGDRRDRARRRGMLDRVDPVGEHGASARGQRPPHPARPHPGRRPAEAAAGRTSPARRCPSSAPGAATSRRPSWRWSRRGRQRPAPRSSTPAPATSTRSSPPASRRASCPTSPACPGPGQMAESRPAASSTARQRARRRRPTSPRPRRRWSSWARSTARSYGVFIKAAVKGLIWYNPKVARLRRQPARDLGRPADARRRRTRARPRPTWCLGIESGAASGWPATDWIEDLVLRQAGPDVYNAAGGRARPSGPTRRSRPRSRPTATSWSRKRTAATTRSITTNFEVAGDPLFARSARLRVPPPGELHHRPRRVQEPDRRDRLQLLPVPRHQPAVRGRGRGRRRPVRHVPRHAGGQVPDGVPGHRAGPGHLGQARRRAVGQQERHVATRTTSASARREILHERRRPSRSTPRTSCRRR